MTLNLDIAETSVASADREVVVRDVVAAASRAYRLELLDKEHPIPWDQYRAGCVDRIVAVPVRKERQIGRHGKAMRLGPLLTFKFREIN